MGSRVRVINVARVHPTGDPSPPCHGEYKLSFLDVVHIAKRPIQRLLLFDGPDLPPFPSIVGTLRSSLAATLAVFLPLAGKLAFRASDGGDVVVDCSPAAVSSGVRFVEAEFLGGGDDMRRLARDAEHDTDAFEQLVPELEEAARLPAPVLAVQVTGAAGAVALGVAIHHAVADGHAVWQFMRAWSAAAREEGSLAGAGLPTPTFDRASVSHPKGGELARTVLRLVAPELPLIRRPPSSAARTLDTAQQMQSRRTFVLRAKEIQALKQQILQQQIGALAGRRSEDPSTKPPSTYVAVTSLVWTSLVRAKPAPHVDAAAEDDDDAAYFMVSADCRRRLRPPLGDGFFGNCVTAFYARARRADLRGAAGGGLARAASAIQDAIREHLAEGEEHVDPLSDFERFLAEGYGAVPRERVSAVGSSHRFMAYETDFGWGAPARVELVSLFARELVTLLGAREEGAVQVSVALDRAVMEDFAACFVVPAPASSDGE